MRRLGVWTTILLAGCAAKASPELDEHHPMVAGLVATLMKYQHYEPRDVDDGLSVAWMDSYLETLDPNRMIFLRSDVEEFKRWERDLDDDIRERKPKLQAAEKIYERYQERMAQRINSVQVYLKTDIDLTADEIWRYDRSEAEWPKTDADADALWQKRIKNEIIIRELAEGVDRERSDITETLQNRYTRILRDTASANANDMLELYLGAFTRTFDPHSAYFKPATNEDFEIEISNSLEGIGARLQAEGDYTLVKDIVPGGPAERDGELQPGDKIIAVGQGADEPEDVVGMRLDRVVRLIRGKKNTEVRLTVIPVDDQDTTRVVDITRDKVLLSESDADAKVIEVNGQKLGVIDVPSFYVDNTRRLGVDRYHGVAEDVERLSKELREQDVDGLILDLRGNGGGSLREAVEMAGLFIDKGPMVQVRDRDGETETLSDPAPGLVYEGPMVVLTDPLSASASEIVAGALQDYGRAVVVGAETTHGKGTVQQLLDLDHFFRRLVGGQPEARSGALKLTIQKFYRVSGGSTQNRGVRSDVVLPSGWDGLDVYESDLENALAYDEIAPARYTPVGDLTDVLPTLQQKSAARVAANEDFTELIEQVAQREKDSEEDTISLNLETRRAEQAAEQAADRSDTDDAGIEEETEREPDVTDDFILMEAGAILNDWIALTPS
ncbi:MAG: carboxy terminal-processing peptidase [Myxococcota bacterium]